MATRSVIGYETGNGSEVRLKYNHWDGNPESMLPILNEHYTQAFKVSQLVELGDSSSIGETIEDTVFYGRDRDEVGVDAQTFSGIDKITEAYTFVQHCYIFNTKGEWVHTAV